MRQGISERMVEGMVNFTVHAAESYSIIRWHAMLMNGREIFPSIGYLSIHKRTHADHFRKSYQSKHIL